MGASEDEDAAARAGGEPEGVRGHRPTILREARRRARAGGLVLAVLFALGAPAAAGGESPAGPESGASAAPGRWTVAGGCAAHTARSLSPGPAVLPAVAWRFAARGPIESEPLAWDGRVLVTTRETPTRRALTVLDLGAGTVLSSQTLPASVPLSPTLWDTLVAVRQDARRVELYRLDGPRLVPLRTFRGKDGVSSPLLLDGELWLRVDGALERCDPDLPEPLWSTRGELAFRGEPAVRGEVVYAVAYDAPGHAFLLALRRADGAMLDHVEIGDHGGAIPDASAAIEVCVLADEVFVRHALPVPGPAGEDFRVARVALAAPGRFARGAPVFQPLATLPVPLDAAPGVDEEAGAPGRGSWVALVRAAADVRWIAAPAGDPSGRVRVLADGASHAALLERPAPSVAGDLLHLGELAVDPRDFAILWREPCVPSLRPVPAGDALLVVTDGRELDCLRAPPEPQTPAQRLVGELRRRSAERLASGYARLASEALRTNDVPLLARLVGEAQRRGAAGRALDTARAGLERLQGSGRVLAPDPRRSAALVREEEALLAAPAEELLARANAAGDGAQGRALVRAVLDEDPASAAAAELVASWLPPALPRGAPSATASWLDFLDATARTPVRCVARGDAAPDPAARAEQSLLAEEARVWRPDVRGFASKRLFVVAAPGRPGAVARALDVGELVCDVLEEICAPLGRPAGASDPEPLTLLLYESRDVYLQQSRLSGALPEAAVGWTAGHYDPNAGLSRMYVPEDDADARRLSGVYAHELTHHWLDARSPFAGATKRHASELGRLPGFWIVEGFPTFVEELALDPARRTWSTPDPRAESLDLVANAPDDALLPWERVLGASQGDFLSLGTAPERAVPLAWVLGSRAPRSEVQLFYAQAGALCHWLYEADDGAHRPALLAYLAAWMRADAAGLDPVRAFGLSPAELGRRAREHARAVLGSTLTGE